MIYHIEEKTFCPCGLSDVRPEGGRYFGLFATAELEPVFEALGRPMPLIAEFFSSHTAKFEGYDGYDILHLNLLDYEGITLRPQRVFLYLQRDLLLAFCDSTEVLNALAAYVQNEKEGFSADRAVSHLLSALTAEDPQLLTRMEGRIASLEDRILTGGRGDYLREIIAERRKLLMLKNYYSQFYGVLDGLLENENELSTPAGLHRFKLFSGKLDRLNHHVESLRDYITQVREAYQSQIDIRLNQIMKLFTVLTAIFLPLTLIVGWYGMNLQMPEYGWAYGYPFVVCLSLAVVGFTWAYFKKHRWF